MVIIGLQILGQTVLNFKVSIAQILVTIAVCAVIELAVTLWREQILAWPGSALQTGTSVGFILRASGTRHGDYWSLHGIQYFVIAAALSLLSKYLLRPGGLRHLFNPSNVGLVAVLLVVGPNYVFSEHLWWGRLGPPVLAAYALIVFGGAYILKKVKMIPMAVSFLATFAVLVALFALGGRSFYATWRPDPISGMSYWLNIALSPEVWAYVVFMMSDPQTAPKTTRGRIIYGAATAVLTAGLLLFQPTEFGIKLAILSSLTVTCALVPFIEAVSRRIDARRAGNEPADRAVRVPRRRVPRLGAQVLTPVIAASVIIAVGAAVDTAALVANKDVVLVERDLPTGGSLVSGNVPLHNPHHQ